jgi:hypothetical protein
LMTLSKRRIAAPADTKSIGSCLIETQKLSQDEEQQDCRSCHHFWVVYQDSL